MSDEFWKLHAYDEGEPDRVVMCVELQVSRDGEDVWHKSYALDSCGDAEGSAMGRLVSIPVSLVIEAVLDGRLDAGVHAGTNDVDLINEWLEVLKGRGDTFTLIDHLA